MFPDTMDPVFKIPPSELSSLPHYRWVPRYIQSVSPNCQIHVSVNFKIQCGPCTRKPPLCTGWMPSQGWEPGGLHCSVGQLREQVQHWRGREASSNISYSGSKGRGSIKRIRWSEACAIKRSIKKFCATDDCACAPWLQQHSVGNFFETLDMFEQIRKRELKNTVWKDRTLIVEILQITEKWRFFCLNTFHNVTMILLALKVLLEDQWPMTYDDIQFHLTKPLW